MSILEAGSQYKCSTNCWDYTTRCICPVLLFHGNMMHELVGKEAFARFDYMTFKRLHIDFHDHVVGVYRRWTGIEPNGRYNLRNDHKVVNTK